MHRLFLILVLAAFVAGTVLAAKHGLILFPTTSPLRAICQRVCPHGVERFQLFLDNKGNQVGVLCECPE